MTQPPESFRALFLRSAIPGSSGGMFALYSAFLGFLAVLGVYIRSAVTGEAMPTGTDAILTASVGMLTAHQVRGALADKANANNGLAVPVEAPPPFGPLPDLKPLPDP